MRGSTRISRIAEMQLSVGALLCLSHKDVEYAAILSLWIVWLLGFQTP